MERGRGAAGAGQRAALQRAVRNREEREEGERRKKKRKRKKEKGRERERERKRDRPTDHVAATAAGCARTPVWRDAAVGGTRRAEKKEARPRLIRMSGPVFREIRRSSGKSLSSTMKKKVLKFI